MLNAFSASVFTSVDGTPTSESATWAWAHLLKISLLGLGLHQGFTQFPKALLPMEGYQIIVSEEGY